MKILMIGVLILIIATYPQWSYKKWAERCEEKCEREGVLFGRKVK